MMRIRANVWGQLTELSLVSAYVPTISYLQIMCMSFYVFNASKSLAVRVTVQ